MLVMAKGLTAGYAPLGALGLKQELAAYFDKRMLWAGLTGYAHPISCAAALATIEVMEDEKLIERSRELGVLLQERLNGFADRFDHVGEGRARGLYGVIEFVVPGGGKAPLVAEGATGKDAQALDGVRTALKGLGVHMAIKGPRAFIAPPLTIEPELLTEGLDRLENAMEIGFGTL
jgi:taurine--2-oxoglutarate transaminase